MDSIIDIKNITKEYPCIRGYKELLMSPFKRRYVKALRGVTLSVERGTILGLLGPNGAGKTTLIKILSTLVNPTSGSALVNGFDVVSQDTAVRRSIGIVMTEERSFYWRLSGRQNLEFFAALNNIAPEQRMNRINAVLHMTELEEAGERMFKDYSTGMKQRLAIARGLLCDPDIILLDEPTRSLDPHSARHMRSFIKEKIVGDGKRTALLATHNLQEAEELCSHIAIINQGTIVRQGTVETVKNISHNDCFRLRLAPGSNFTDIGSLPGVADAQTAEDSELTFKIRTADISAVLSAVLAEGGRVIECVKHAPSLEDVFTKIVEQEQGQKDRGAQP
ncbi:ATP-binding cassette domain-containing protein [Thermodesulfobacteriota bacterium]